VLQNCKKTFKNYHDTKNNVLAQNARETIWQEGKVKAQKKRNKTEKEGKGNGQRKRKGRKRESTPPPSGSF